MSIEQYLFDRYGPLLTLLELAEVLKRTPDGLRVTLARKNDLSDKLNPWKIKIGRRVYFPVSAIADLVGE